MLCGKIGGGANPHDKFADKSSSRWYNACSPEARQRHVHRRPLSDILDLSGNVAEWEDSCDGTTGGDDLCRIRGGSYASAPADLRCDADASIARKATSATIGFRCCL